MPADVLYSRRRAFYYPEETRETPAVPRGLRDGLANDLALSGAWFPLPGGLITA